MAGCNYVYVGQYANSSGHRTFCYNRRPCDQNIYAELVVSSLVVEAVNIASSSIHGGMARLS